MIQEKLKDLSIPYEENVSLKGKTWLKTGGQAALWIAPSSVDQLKAVLAILSDHSCEYEIVGHTSNIYYLDTYNPSVVISTLNLKKYQECQDFIFCECGVPVSSLSRYAVSCGYVGYSGLVNLPGTVGAAICNNSSCFDCSVSKQLIEAEFFNKTTNEIQVLKPEDFNYSHRSSDIKKGVLKGVILSAKLAKHIGIIEQEKQKAEEATRVRHLTQEPPAYTLGSMYANLRTKKVIRNLIVGAIGFVMRLLHIPSMAFSIKLRLAIWGYNDLTPFVSSKNINTFKWLKNRDDRHQKFLRYIEFVNKAYESPILEIEIREKK